MIDYRVAQRDQGQIVEIAYGWDMETGELIERITDRSDGEVTTRVVELADGATWDGWGRPDLTRACRS